MAVAFQAASESHTGTTGAASVASFTWNHALTSTSEGLAVFVYGFAVATDIITSVTVGGITVPLIGTVAASFAADTVTEPGFVEVYFLSGTTLPSITSAIVVNRTNNTTVTYANAISVTSTVLPLQIKGLTELNEDQTALTGVTINDGGAVGSSLRMIGLYSGAGAAPIATAATTVGPAGLNIVIGAASCAATYYELTAGSGSRSIGFASTSDDTALIAFAIGESPVTSIAPLARNVIAGAATSGAWTLEGVTVGFWYRLESPVGVAMGNGTQATTTGGQSLTAITNTAVLPTAGSTITYTLTQASTQTGTYYSTGKTVTLTGITPSVVNDSQTFNTGDIIAGGAFSHTIARSTIGTGGTVQYATSSSNVYNTGLIDTWQTSANFTLNAGSTYYLWVRHSSTQPTDVTYPDAVFADSAGPFLIDVAPTYANLASSITGAGHSNQYFASFAATPPTLGGSTVLGGGTAATYTVTGLATGVTTTASITAGNATFSKSGSFGPYVTTDTVTNGDILYCQFLAPNAINTPETYTLKIGTVSRSVTITTGAILPDRLVDLTVTPYVTTLPFAQSGASVAITGGTSGHEYTIGSGNVFITILATPVAAAAGGTATVVIPNANLPTNATVWVNRLYVRVPVALGGNNIWSSSDPMGIGSINGGASGNLEWNWNRATSATTLSITSVTQGAQELTGGSTSSVSISWTATATNSYRVVRTDLDPSVIVVAETSGASHSLLTASLPLEGISADYIVQVRKTTANGGDGIWYSATGTNNPFSILRIKEPTVKDVQSFDVTSQTSTITHSIQLAKDQGLGGTLQFNITTAPNAVYPSTGWVNEASNSWTLTRGTSYYFWARRSTDLADYDISAIQLVPQPEKYGLQIFDNTGAIVFDTTTIPVSLIGTKNSGGSIVNSVSLVGQATATIYAEGMTATNTAEVYIISKGPIMANGSTGLTVGYSITRGTGSFVVKNLMSAGFAASTISFIVGTYV